MKKEKSLLSGSTTLLVLSLLESQDRYGYEMIAELERRSDNTFTLKEGTLYPILHGLEREELIQSYLKAAGTDESAGNGRSRKYYHITPAGLRALAEKKAEWRRFSACVNPVIGGEAHAYASI